MVFKNTAAEFEKYRVQNWRFFALSITKVLNTGITTSREILPDNFKLKHLNKKISYHGTTTNM